MCDLRTRSSIHATTSVDESVMDVCQISQRCLAGFPGLPLSSFSDQPKATFCGVLEKLSVLDQAEESEWEARKEKRPASSIHSFIMRRA